MASSYFNSVRGETRYRKWLTQENSSLEEHIEPGSGWDARHLAACHIVVAVTGKNYLPLLNTLYPRVGKTFATDDGNKEMAAFTSALSQNHRNMREHALIREPTVGVSLARFWVSLRDVKKCNVKDGDPEVRRRSSTRGITQATKSGFVNPEKSSQSQHQETPIPSSDPISDSGVYSEEQAPAPNLPVEDYAVQLAFAVLNHILLYTQDPLLDTPFEIRQRERWVLNIDGKSITAIDDGGLSLVDGSGTKTKKSVVLIEAKRRLEVCNKRNQPVLSNNLLAQMTCEALAARSSGRDEQMGDNVFVINISQHYMCFFHFAITETQVEEIENGETPDKAIRVTATKWLDLGDASDRKIVVRNVCQLAKYMRGEDVEE